MKILVDADACPVKKIIEKVAKEYQIPVTMFIDTSHELYSEYSEIVTVSKAPDAVDFALMNRAKKGDVVVTGDYGVAAMALSKGANAIHQGGMIYTNETIDRMLFERHLASVNRKSGKHGSHMKGPKKRTSNDDMRFETMFRKLIFDLLNLK
ncbi:YaiI/YqxD family protein [Clostridium sp. Marseille-P299]|uniref:YaiI/YqxD family protein n=1 Tax=Clostridium sp. Marseille-P299 TaxID=1805477 RepID=UPI00082C747D|nr:YaiI/YqxD family protein [Clostridium sp. Marseille-P299]